MNATKVSLASLVAVTGLALAALVFGMQAQAGDKVAVCHTTSSDENPIVEIVISDNALQNHLDHGDTLYSTETGCGSDDGGGPDPV